MCRPSGKSGSNKQGANAKTSVYTVFIATLCEPERHFNFHCSPH